MGDRDELRHKKTSAPPPFLLSQKAHIQRLASGLTGCINIDTNLQPTDPSIKPTVRGEDCTAIILGLGFGTNTVEQAMDKGRISRNPERPERSEPADSEHYPARLAISDGW